MGLFDIIKSKLKEWNNSDIKNADRATKIVESGKTIKAIKEEFDKLNSAMKDFGYSLAGMEKPTTEKTKNPRVTDATSSDALINSLLEMDNDYRKSQTGVDLSVPTIPNSLGLTEREYTARTDEELREQAEAELLPELTEDKNQATEKLQSTLNALDKKEGESLYQEALAESELQREYQDSLTDHRDNMIFRGLTNSSINTGGRESINREYDYQSALIDEKYDLKYRDILSSRQEAELEFQNAMESYDLNYSLELQEKLQKLRAEEEKRLIEINKYNLEIRKKELEYQLERQKTLTELRENRQKALFDEMAREQADEKLNGVSPEKSAEYKKRADMAKNFYQNFSSEQASAMMGAVGEELISLLGEGEYFNLLRWNSNR